MGLFKKKEKKEEEGIPRLPDIPRLPELPDFKEMDNYSDSRPSQLPSFPNNFTGNKFSQNSIKDAVTGKEEVEEEANDFAMEDERQMMQRPPIEEKKFYSQPLKMKEKSTEPLFIRIDKFEDGSRAFEEVKKQVSDIEKLFNDLKKVKESEDNEIKSFESEIKQIKDKLENIDRNIFSKIE